MTHGNPYEAPEAGSLSVLSRPNHPPMPALLAGMMVIVSVWAAVIGFVAEFDGPIYSTQLITAMMVGGAVGVVGPLLLHLLRAYLPSVTVAVAFVALWVLGSGVVGYAAAYYLYSLNFGC